MNEICCFGILREKTKIAKRFRRSCQFEKIILIVCCLGEVFPFEHANAWDD